VPPGFEERERHLPALSREQARAGAGQYRVHEQGKLVEMTTFAALFINSAWGGAPGPVNTARNSSYERRPYRWVPPAASCGMTAWLSSSS
jgi:hypothetical protein